VGIVVEDAVGGQRLEGRGVEDEHQRRHGHRARPRPGRAALARDPFPTSRDDVLARRAARQKASPYSGAWRRGIV